MGIKTLFLTAASFLGIATYLTFSLGPRMPQAGRILGHKMGLFNLYFKTILKIYKPSQHQAKQVLRIAKQIDQHSLALKRQFQSQILRAKHQFKNQLPKQLFQELKQTSATEEESKGESRQRKDITWDIYKVLKQRGQAVQKRKVVKQAQQFYKLD